MLKFIQLSTSYLSIARQTSSNCSLRSFSYFSSSSSTNDNSYDNSDDSDNKVENTIIIENENKPSWSSRVRIGKDGREILTWQKENETFWNQDPKLFELVQATEKGEQPGLTTSKPLYSSSTGLMNEFNGQLERSSIASTLDFLAELVPNDRPGIGLRSPEAHFPTSCLASSPHPKLIHSHPTGTAYYRNLMNQQIFGSSETLFKSLHAYQSQENVVQLSQESVNQVECFLSHLICSKATFDETWHKETRTARGNWIYSLAPWNLELESRFHYIGSPVYPPLNSSEVGSGDSRDWSSDIAYEPRFDWSDAAATEEEHGQKFSLELIMRRYLFPEQVDVSKSLLFDSDLIEETHLLYFDEDVLRRPEEGEEAIRDRIGHDIKRVSIADSQPLAQILGLHQEIPPALLSRILLKLSTPIQFPFIYLASQSWNQLDSQLGVEMSEFYESIHDMYEDEMSRSSSNNNNNNNNIEDEEDEGDDNDDDESKIQAINNTRTWLPEPFPSGWPLIRNIDEHLRIPLNSNLPSKDSSIVYHWPQNLGRSITSI